MQMTMKFQKDKQHSFLFMHEVPFPQSTKGYIVPGVPTYSKGCNTVVCIFWRTHALMAVATSKQVHMAEEGVLL